MNVLICPAWTAYLKLFTMSTTEGVGNWALEDIGRNTQHPD
jgi:hypothetical protein